METNKKDVLVCICGGGYLGVENAVGALMAMDDAKVRPTKLMGSSAGGLVAALYASLGFCAYHIFEMIRKNDTSKWFKLKPFQVFKSLFGLSNYAFDTTGLYKMLKKKLTVAAYDNVTVTTTDLDVTPLKRCFHKATPSTTLATMSIPSATPPVMIDGHRHGDGGVRDLLPMPPLHEFKNYKHIYLIICPDDAQPFSSVWGFLQNVVRAFTGTMAREIQQIRDLELEKAYPNVTVLDPPPVKSGGILTWSTGYEATDSAYTYTMQRLMEDVTKASVPTIIEQCKD